MSEVQHVGIDDLRRLAIGLLSCSGLEASYASRLAAYLLWFDVAGAPNFGMATLGDWLERIEAGEFSEHPDGKIVQERPALTLLDGTRGIGPLVLEHASRLAVEKARDTGIGLTRVCGLAGSIGPCGPVVASVAASGPELGLAASPGGAWAVAVPSWRGEPVLLDTALVLSRGKRAKNSPELADLLPEFAWLAVERTCLVAAVTLTFFESPTMLEERVTELVNHTRPRPGLLLPEELGVARSKLDEEGVPLKLSAWHDLSKRAEARGLVF